MLFFLRIFNLINKFEKKNKVGREERDRERRIKIEVKHRNKEKWASPLLVVLCETLTICHPVRKIEFSQLRGQKNKWAGFAGQYRVAHVRKFFF